MAVHYYEYYIVEQQSVWRRQAVRAGGAATADWREVLESLMTADGELNFWKKLRLLTSTSRPLCVPIGR